MDKDRYPGLSPFEKHDNAVFFGREREAIELLNRIKAERVTILYAESGIGKSSLLNAGVSHELEKAGYQPIYVRLQKHNSIEKAEEISTDSNCSSAPTTPLSLLEEAMNEAFNEAYKKFNNQEFQIKKEEKIINKSNNITNKSQSQAKSNEYIYTPKYPSFWEKDQAKLWEKVKVYSFPNGAVPILIFDQFEEFSLYTPTERKEFTQQLAELVNDTIPTRIYSKLFPNAITIFDDELEDGKDSEKVWDSEILEWANQPEVKCVFAIRSDRLAEIDELKLHLPMAFRNRYRLHPLKKEQARRAIQEPSTAQGDFTTPSFEYDPEVLDNIILSYLADKNDIVDSSQLQMICNYIENTISDAEGVKRVVDKTIVPNEEKLKKIIEDFYQNQLNSLGINQEIELARQVLEDHFVVQSQRVGIDEIVLLKLLAENRDLITKLQKARLIRSEQTSRGILYELSHDKLIEPVEKSKVERDKVKDLEAQKHKLEAEKALKDEEIARQKLALELAETERLKLDLERQKLEQKRIIENQRLEAEKEFAIRKAQEERRRLEIEKERELKVVEEERQRLEAEKEFERKLKEAEKERKGPSNNKGKGC